MLQNLANILTSEFLARNPPWIVKQMAKVLGVTGRGGYDDDSDDPDFGGTKTNVGADISSDDGSDEAQEEADYGNMDHLLTSAVRKVALHWLGYVRVPEKKNAYDISTDSDSSQDVDYQPAIITDAIRDISEIWLRKVAKLLRAERQQAHDIFQADISSDSESGSDGDFGVMEHVNEVTVAIAMRWLSKIRAPPPTLTAGGLRADISSDDSDDEDEPAVEYNFEPPTMSAKTTNIAFRWLRSIRSRLRPTEAKVIVDISSDSEGDDEDMMNTRISSDDESDSGADQPADDLHHPRVKAVAYKWLRRVRKAPERSAWEDETAIIEDVAPKKRLERHKPKRK